MKKVNFLILIFKFQGLFILANLLLKTTLIFSQNPFYIDFFQFP